MNYEQNTLANMLELAPNTTVAIDFTLGDKEFRGLLPSCNDHLLREWLLSPLSGILPLFVFLHKSEMDDQVSCDLLEEKDATAILALKPSSKIIIVRNTGNESKAELSSMVDSLSKLIPQSIDIVYKVQEDWRVKRNSLEF